MSRVIFFFTVLKSVTTHEGHAVEKYTPLTRGLLSAYDLVGFLPSEKKCIDINSRGTKEMKKREALLSPSCPIRNILLPQRQVGHQPNQAQPDDGGQLTGHAAFLPTSDNSVSIVELSKQPQKASCSVVRIFPL